jgi:peptide/nickel transport system substrate-binding protein
MRSTSSTRATTGRTRAIRTVAVAAPTSSSANYARLNDPAVNGLLDQMKAAKTPAEAAGLASKLDAQVMSDAVYIPYGYDTLLLGRGKDVTNYYISSAYDGLVDLVALGVVS